jgi:hypothetical protein
MEEKMIKVNVNRKERRLNVLTTIDNPKVYIEWIVKFSAMPCCVGDTLTITWNVQVGLYEGIKRLDKKLIKFEVKHEFKKNEVVNYAHLIYSASRKEIKIYQDLPKQYE